MQNFSIGEQEWLLYLEDKLEVTLDRQTKIGKYHVDGYDPRTKTVYEFNGCFWHGCSRCFQGQIINQQNKKSMKTLLVETMSKRAALIDMGYKVKTMWGHQWSVLRGLPHIQELIDDNQERLRVPYLRIKEGMKGGRTEVFKLYKKAKKGETIKYVDYTSLYPSINATCKYPAGHHEVIKDNFKPISEYFGFVYCKVKQVKYKHIPTLPRMYNGKLMFMNRPMVGVWSTLELQMAVNAGNFKIAEMYEVWHWKETTTELFKDYMKCFYKIKAESSVKFPKNATAEMKKDIIDRIISDNINSICPIQLDRAKMCFNPGLKQIAKIFINNLWGRYAMRTDRVSVAICTSHQDLYATVFDESKQIIRINEMSDKLVEVHYKTVQQFISNNNTLNISIAAFTSSYARTLLYDLMNKVGHQRVIYCDTDSVIYHCPKDETIPLSCGMGGVTDELEGKLCDEIVCLGPKTYALHLHDAEGNDAGTKVKAKGFRMNQTVGEKINYDTFRKMVGQAMQHESQSTELVKTVTVLYPKQIRIDQKTKRLKSKDGKKDFKLSFNKCLIDWYKKTRYELPTLPL